MARLSFSLYAAILIHECTGFIALKTSQRQNRPLKSAPSQLSAVHKDIVIIGGSLAGLSIALDLATSGKKCQVTILDGADPAISRSQTEFGKTNIASMAAAGMLAPMSERLPSGPLLDICLQSRAMYAEWVQKVEKMAKTGPLGEKYLWQDDLGQSTMEPWEIGYKCTGGFLAPAFAGDSVATWAPPEEGGEAIWLDQPQILEMEPNINSEVVGGWWFPSDASVDARRLTCSLRAACANCGVELCYGEDYKVTGVDQSNPDQIRVLTSSGVTYEPDKVVTANGAWMKEILPIAIVPHKGQSLSVTLRDGEGIDRVLFAQDTYIVPKADGRIIVGATVEPNTFDNEITPAGMMHIISNACELLPSIAHGKIGEVWCGLRPTTPDKAPILGTAKHQQLFVAGGYWRNGVLLAPKTAQIMSDLILSSSLLSNSDQELLDAFNWDRFYDKDKSKQLAADIRYKSQMHTVQYRGKGSATAGVELGFYEGASAAKNEREADRKQLWSSDNDDSAFEKAAAMGMQDATAFVMGERVISNTSNTVKFELDQGRLFPDLEVKNEPIETSSDIDAHDKANALTIGSSTFPEMLSLEDNNRDRSRLESEKKDEDKGPVDLKDQYAIIKANKAVSTPMVEICEEGEEREEFDFELYWVDPETGEKMYVPPYTSPAEVEEMVALKNQNTSENIQDSQSQINIDETTYDGYTDIMNANSREYRSEELSAMRKARISNRGMQSEAFGSIGNDDEVEVSSEPKSSRLEALYNSINKNKDASNPDVEDVVDYENNRHSKKVLYPKSSSEPDEKTFDGYTEIQDSNSRSTRAEELEAMRAARIANRGMESETFGSS